MQYVEYIVAILFTAALGLAAVCAFWGNTVDTAEKQQRRAGARCVAARCAARAKYLRTLDE